MLNIYMMSLISSKKEAIMRKLIVVAGSCLPLLLLVATIFIGCGEAEDTEMPGINSAITTSNFYAEGTETPLIQSIKSVTCPSINVPGIGFNNSYWPSTHETTNGRLYRDGVSGSCGTTPSVRYNDSTARPVDVYQFENENLTTDCATATVTAGCDLLPAVYSDSFDPSSLTQNFLSWTGGSLGASGGQASFSFNITAGQDFYLAIMPLTAGISCPYTIAVTGTNWCWSCSLVVPALNHISDFNCDNGSNTFSWISSENLHYDIIVNSQRVVTNITTTNVTLPSTFIYQELNTWQIAATDCNGSEALSSIETFNATSTTPPVAPVLTPQVDIVCDSEETTFSWSGGSATAYDLVLNGERVRTMINGSSVTLPVGYPFNSNNAWSMVAKNCIGEEANSAEDTFQVISTATPQPATITSPNQGATVLCDQTFTWTYPTNPLPPDIYFDIKTVEGTVLAENIAALSWTPSVDQRLASGEYAIRVWAKNCAGYSVVSTNTRVFTVDNMPLTPIYDSPGPNDYTNTTPTLSWRVDGTQKTYVTYNLYLDSSEIANGLAQTSYAIATPLEERAYSWYIEAVGCMGETVTSGASRSFSVDATPPNDFDLLNPSDGAWQNSNEFNFSWEEATDGLSGLYRYTLVIDGNEYTDIAEEAYSITLQKTFQGYLAVPRNLDENNYLWGGASTDTWIGVNDINQEGVYISDSTGLPVVYTNWNSGEPNNQNNEDCIELQPSNGKWNDYECTSTHSRYYCSVPYESKYGCPQYYSQRNDLCFRYRGVSNTWTNARSDCHNTFTLLRLEGAFTWFVIAFDNVGNEKISETFATGIDKTNPNSAAGGLQDLFSFSKRPTFNWTAASDALSGIGRYEVFIGSTSLGSVAGNTLTFTPSSDIAEGSYSWKVRAYDKASNYLDSTSKVLVIDQTNPISATLLDVLPKGTGDWVSTKYPTFKFTATDNVNGSGIDHFDVFTDGSKNNSVPIVAGSGSYDGSPCSPNTCFDTNVTINDGQHHWYIIAYDKVGLSLQSSEGTFTVDSEAPLAFNHESPASGSAVASKYPLLCWNRTSDAGSGLLEYRLNVKLVGGSDVANITVPADGQSSGVMCQRLESALANGDYTWLVTAYDNAQKPRTANGGTRWSMTINPDVTPPTSSITPAAPGEEPLGCLNNSFWGIASDPGPTPTSPPGSGVVEVQVQMNSTSEAGWVSAALGGTPSDRERTWTWTWPEAESNTHTLFVRAIDREGNVQNSPSQRTVLVDCDGPVVGNLLLPENDGWRLAKPAFSWEAASDSPAGMGHYELRIRPSAGGDESIINVGLVTSHTLTDEQALSEGTYTWYVRAFDTRNNSTPYENRTVQVDLSGPVGFSLTDQTPLQIHESQPWGCNGRSITVSWNPTSDPKSGLDTNPYQVMLDGNPVGSRRSQTNYTLTNLWDGHHDWTVIAYDKLGNSTTATPYQSNGSFDIDCTPPGVSDAVSLRLHANDIPTDPFDTGMDIQPGDNVKIWANGMLCFVDDRSCDPARSHGSCMGPEGNATFPPGVGATKYYQDILFGKLVAYLTGQIASPHEIGGYASITFSDGGRLYLAENDNDQFNCLSRWQEVTVHRGPGFELLEPVDHTISDNPFPTLKWSDATDQGIGVQKLVLSVYKSDGNDFLVELPASTTQYTITGESQRFIEGDSTWKIIAYDYLNNSSTSSTWTIRTDLTPPEAFTVTLPEEGDVVKTKTPSLTWNLTTDAQSSVAHYLIFIGDRGDEQYNNAQYPNLNNQTPKGNLDEGQHCFYVVAQDVLRHETQSTNERCFIVDTLPPDPFFLISPEDGNTSYTAMPEFCWETTEDFGTGVQRYELYVSGYQPVTIPQPQESPFPDHLCWQATSIIPNGVYDWYVKAFDDAGGVTTTDPWQITIERDLTPPQVLIDSPVADAIFGLSGVPVNGTAVDPQPGTGLGKVEVGDASDPNSWQEASLDPQTGYWQMLWPVSSTGTLTLCARGWDREGNINPDPPSQGSYPCVTVRTDVTPPTVFDVLSPAGNQWVSSRPTFSWTAATDEPAGVCHYFLKINGQEDIDAETQTSFTLPPERALPDGSYTWTVQVADCQGNSRNADRSESFRVDGLAPNAVTLQTPADGVWLNAARPQLCWNAATDNGSSGIKQYRVNVNGSPHYVSSPSTCWSPSSDLGEGTYSWDVAAIDQALNVGPVSPSRVFKLDLTAPPTPVPTDPLDNALIRNNPPTFYWQRVTDLPAVLHSGVCGYVITLNGQEAVAGPDANSLTWPEVITEGDAVWTVKAFDCIDNYSQPSTERHLHMDTTPPTQPEITSPGSGAWLSTARPNITWNASTDPLTGVCKYFLTVDGTELELGNAVRSYTPTSDLSEGSHTIKLKSEDCAGNQGTEAQRGFGIDLTPPSTPVLTAPSDGTCINSQLPTLTWQLVADSYSGVASLELLLDSIVIQSDISATATSQVSLTQITEGPHNWQLRAIDRTGHTALSLPESFSVDLTLPSCAIERLEEKQGEPGTYVVYGVADGLDACGLALAEVKINDDEWVTATEDPQDGWLSWTFDLTPQSEGSYDIQCRSLDHAGNHSTVYQVSADIDQCHEVGDCDTETKVCSVNLPDTTSCDADGSGCTVDDTCQAGVCTAGDTPDCSDQDDQCNTGICNSTGINTYACGKNPTPHNGQSCNQDSNGCTVDDTCQAGSCMAGAAPDCSAQNDQCNTGACSSTGDNTYTCVKDPTPHNGQSCNQDSNGCTVDDTCQAGSCIAGAAPDCSTQNDQCNTGACSSTGNNTYACVKNPTPHNGQSCNQDSNGCTLDACQAGTCVIGTAPDCSSQNDQCNAGICNSTGNNTYACVKNPTPHNGQSCNQDSNGCTVDDTCQAGSCVAGAAPDCSAQNDQCNTGACSSTGDNTYTCVKDPTPHNGQSCNQDSNGCTLDTCQTGACVIGAAPDCSAQNDQCNTGTCNSTGNNTYSCVKNPMPHNGQSCNQDSNGCTLDTCQTGACVVGAAPDCSEQDDQCNSDACSSTGSDTHVCVKDPTPKEGMICNQDSNGCTLDTCQTGACVVGAAPDCSAQNDQCNTGVCSSTGNNTHTCIKDPTSHENLECNDLNACTSDDHCASGSCVGTMKDCSDGIACTQDDCNPENAECEHVVDDLACSDDNPCTTDVCNESTGCSNAAITDWSSCEESAHACFSGMCEPLAENDTCETAIELAAGQAQEITIQGYHAYLTVPESCLGRVLSGKDAFFTFTIEYGKNYELSVRPTQDTDIAVTFWSDCQSTSECIAGVDDGSVGVQETVEASSADYSGNAIIQVVALAYDDSDENSGYTIRIDEITQPDGDEDEIDQEEMEVDGDQVEADGDLDRDLDEEQIPDGDLVDGDHPTDGDELVTDGDQTIVDGDEMVTDGDTPTADGDTTTEPQGGGGGGGCSSTNSGFGWFLGVLLALAIMARRRKEA